MENYVGKRLDGRYEVQEIIGVGGMSVVYKAYDNVDDRIVAIKILKDEFSDDEEFGIFINYASCFKMADEGLYDVAISRRDKKKSYLVQTFVDNFKNKTEFSDEECKMFEQMVILTLNAYEDLRKNNDNFSFSIIDSMGGVQPNAR